MNVIWATTFAQIYPELAQLENDGYLARADDSQGARPRSAYTLTQQGHDALDSWLRAPDQPMELRDEGLLRLSFADNLPPEDALALVAQLRERSEQAEREFIDYQIPLAEAGVELQGLRFPLIVARMGAAYHAWAIEWFAKVENELKSRPRLTPKPNARLATRPSYRTRGKTGVFAVAPSAPAQERSQARPQRRRRVPRSRHCRCLAAIGCFSPLRQTQVGVRTQGTSARTKWGALHVPSGTGTVWCMVGKPSGNGRRRERLRRQQLLDAATDYVIANGLAATSLRPLAASLGTSHKTLLYHFGTKEQMFAAILREARTRERLRAAARRAPEGEIPPYVERLWATWKYLSGTSEDDFWRFYFEVHALALRDPAQYEEGLRDGVDDWVSGMQASLVGEGHAPSRARNLATLVLAAFRGLELDLLTAGDRKRVDGAMRELVAAIAATMPAAQSAQREP